MPAKIIFTFASVIFQIFVVCTVPAITFAQPPWCPDLTNDDFVNFLDFSVQADNWLQSGSALPGDFNNNGLVDINDFDYLADWWLHNCYNPPDVICPGCIFPDCNLMDCNTPSSVSCQYCETTPPFIKVKIAGNHGCGCTYGEYPEALGSIYCDITNTADGNYIVPYHNSCYWSGIFKTNCTVHYYWNGLPPCDPFNENEHSPDSANQIQISVYRIGGDRVSIEADWLKDGNDFAWSSAFTGISSSIGCIEAFISGPDCPEPYSGYCETSGGSANISPRWTLMPETINIELLFPEQKELIQLQEITISWLNE